MIGRGIAIALVLLCGACGQKGQRHREHRSPGAAEVNAADAANASPEDGDTALDSDQPHRPAGSLTVTTGGLEVADKRGVTKQLPFGTAEAVVVAAVEPAVGVAEKVFSVPCGGRQVTEHDFQSLTLSFEGGALVSWRAFGTVRMPDGIGEGTPRYVLAAAYPDLRKTSAHPALDLAERFAAGPIRGYLREDVVASIDAGKPLCIE